MARRVKKATKTAQYVAVAMVRDEEEAREYQSLLSGNDIPVKINEHHSQDQTTEGFEVLVPEEYVDEAYVIIESSDAYEDFYDLTLGDEDDDFNDDFFDDEEF
jgi:hypothetical protein